MKKFLAIGALLCAATAANAGITVLIDPTSPTGPDGNGYYTYEYILTQTAADEFRTNNFFTLFDFNGLVTAAGHAPTGPNADWDVDYALVGAGAPSVTFTYEGAAAITAAQVSGFTIKSTIGPDTLPNIPTQGTNWSGQGTPNNTGGATYGPDQDPIVPEPATMSLMGGALLGLGVLARRRK